MKHEEYLFEISKKIADLLGLNFQPNQFNDLERCIIATAKDLKLDISIPHIYNWLSKPSLTNIELKTLSANLTIGETYFFREQTALDLFKNNIIPTLIEQRQNKNQKIRIWSAGCSSGEEPYTLAMILKEYFPELNNWDITILASDINPNAIQKALKGEYTEWSFRDTDIITKNKYFTSSGKLWSIVPEIKKMVTFSYLNLAKNSYPSSLTNTEEMDVIFCRNVMMYFTPQVINEVSNRFYNSINENGWQITSQVELNDEYFSDFERIHYKKSIFYQKTNRPKVSLKTQTFRTSVLPVSTTMHYIKKTEGKKAVTKSTIKNIEKESVAVLKSPPIAKEERSDIDTLFQRGEYQQCIKYCLKFIEKGKLNNDIFLLLVKSYANSGQQAASNEIIKDIISKNIATPEMHYHYASFLNEQNDLKQTEIVLKKAIYLNHKHILSHLMLGDICLKNDKKQLAFKYYKTAAELLEEYNDNEIVPESGGITAGRIKALANSFINNQ